MCSRNCFFFIILLFVLASCQPEPDDTLLDPPAPTDPVTPPVLPNDSIYIRTMVIVDTDAAPGTDTIEKYVFHYDGLKRLDSLEWYDYEWHAPDGTYIHNYEKRYYNGNDTLPYKVMGTHRISPGTPVNTFTSYFQYLNGVVAHDSVIEASGTNVFNPSLRKYKLLGNGKFEQTDYAVPGSGPIYSVDSTISVQTLQNGNIISQLDTSFNAMAYHNVKLIQEFDSHPNPLRRITIPYMIVTRAGFNNYPYLQRAVLNNNETKTQRYVEGTIYDDYTTTYKYRADGFPVEAVETWDGDYHYRTTYTYQK